MRGETLKSGWQSVSEKWYWWGDEQERKKDYLRRPWVIFCLLGVKTHYRNIPFYMGTFVGFTDKLFSIKLKGNQVCSDFRFGDTFLEKEKNNFQNCLSFSSYVRWSQDPVRANWLFWKWSIQSYFFHSSLSFLLLYIHLRYMCLFNPMCVFPFVMYISLLFLSNLCPFVIPPSEVHVSTFSHPMNVFPFVIS